MMVVLGFLKLKANSQLVQRINVENMKCVIGDIESLKEPEPQKCARRTATSHALRGPAQR